MDFLDQKLTHTVLQEHVSKESPGSPFASNCNNTYNATYVGI